MRTSALIGRGLIPLHPDEAWRARPQTPGLPLCSPRDTTFVNWYVPRWRVTVHAILAGPERPLASGPFLPSSPRRGMIVRLLDADGLVQGCTRTDPGSPRWLLRICVSYELDPVLADAAHTAGTQ